MAPFKDKHHPSTLSDVGTNPVGPAGVVQEEWRAMLISMRSLVIGGCMSVRGQSRLKHTALPDH
jgi:hypothetical protein